MAGRPQTTVPGAHQSLSNRRGLTHTSSLEVSVERPTTGRQQSTVNEYTATFPLGSVPLGQAKDQRAYPTQTQPAVQKRYNLIPYLVHRDAQGHVNARHRQISIAVQCVQTTSDGTRIVQLGPLLMAMRAYPFGVFSRYLANPSAEVWVAQIPSADILIRNHGAVAGRRFIGNLTYALSSQAETVETAWDDNEPSKALARSYHLGHHHVVVIYIQEQDPLRVSVTTTMMCTSHILQPPRRPPPSERLSLIEASPTTSVPARRPHSLSRDPSETEAEDAQPARKRQAGPTAFTANPSPSCSTFRPSSTLDSADDKLHVFWETIKPHLPEKQITMATYPKSANLFNMWHAAAALDRLADLAASHVAAEHIPLPAALAGTKFKKVFARFCGWNSNTWSNKIRYYARAMTLAFGTDVLKIPDNLQDSLTAIRFMCTAIQENRPPRTLRDVSYRISDLAPGEAMASNFTENEIMRDIVEIFDEIEGPGDKKKKQRYV